MSSPDMRAIFVCLSLRLFADGIVNESGDPEFMPVSVAYSGYGLQKVDMPVPCADHSACLPAKLVKMILIEIRAEPDFMHMVVFSLGHSLSRYGRETVVMRVFAGLRYFNAALHLMDVSLAFRAIFMRFFIRTIHMAYLLATH
jgi:hypothetical protein